MGSILKILILAAVSFAYDVKTLDKKFPKEKVSVGKEYIEIYVADNDQKRALGLMHVPSLPENVGMLFVFEEARVQAFWMKDTIMDLSIGFFNSRGELIDVQEMKATSMMDIHPPTYQSSGPAMFALEMNPHWFAKHNVKIGARIKLSKKSSSRLLSKQLPISRQ